MPLKYENMPANPHHKTTPAFDDLPLREGDPPYSAWGLWGEDDNIGMLVRVKSFITCVVPADYCQQNWLSKEVVKDAATEIREGLRFSLK